VPIKTTRSLTVAALCGRANRAATVSKRVIPIMLAWLQPQLEPTGFSQ